MTQTAAGDGQGPLHGVRVVELAGIGPAPFAVMLLADMGASVVRIDRAGSARPEYPPNPVVDRGRRSVAVDLKQPRGVRVVLDLVRDADVLVESFRPGVVERLGLGPDACLDVNPRLVYGRLSGWGQGGPWAPAAGHDINYIGLTGALWSIGREGEAPVPPLNLVGDLGAAGPSLALGVLCALLERRVSGRGQVVETSILDATATLMSHVHGLRATGMWANQRAANLLDTGCPYYEVYACADGRWMAMGSIEERFFLNALDVLDVASDDPVRTAHADRSQWPALRERLTAAFGARSRDEWAEAFRGRDCCVTPVLDLDEAPLHEQATARGAYRPIPGSTASQPVVTPTFSRSATSLPPPGPAVGAHTDEILAEIGYAPEQVAALLESGVVASARS